MKHELEVWNSEGRKEALAAQAAMLKEYERAELEESRIKSENVRVVSVARDACRNFFCLQTPFMFLF